MKTHNVIKTKAQLFSEDESFCVEKFTLYL